MCLSVPWTGSNSGGFAAEVGRGEQLSTDRGPSWRVNFRLKRGPTYLFSILTPLSIGKRRLLWWVCLSVRDRISGTTRLIFDSFIVSVTYDRSSVLLWRHYDTLFPVLGMTPYLHKLIGCRRRRQAEAARLTRMQPWAWTSGGLPIRQKRQLPKDRHGAGARPVHCEFFYT